MSPAGSTRNLDKIVVAFGPTGKAGEACLVLSHRSRHSPTMASKKIVNAENLETLGAKRLATLLMEAAERDAGIKRRLRLELAVTKAPESLAAEVRKGLVRLAVPARMQIGTRPANLQLILMCSGRQLLIR